MSEYCLKGEMFLISPKSDCHDLEKLNLWKSTYALFGKYSIFEGPFYTEGYLNKKIGVQISRNGQTYVDIDLLATKEDGSWIGIELTTDPDAKKDEQLEKYLSITSNELGHLIALNIGEQKEIFLIDTTHIDSEYAQITFDNQSNISVTNEMQIKNEKLRKRLLSLNEKPIPISPSISFTMAPASTPFEVKTALVPLILQLLTDKIKSISAEEMVKLCLTSLFEDISHNDKKGLIKITKSSMVDLINNYLPNYLQIKDDRYIRSDKKLSINTNSLQSVHNLIDKWVHSKKSTQTFLDGFES